jgi:hypothetical protein
MRETLLSRSNPILFISEQGTRFTKAKLQPGTFMFDDYHEWKQESKGVGPRAKKVITLQGNLKYIIQP